MKLKTSFILCLVSLLSACMHPSTEIWEHVPQNISVYMPPHFSYTPSEESTTQFLQAYFSPWDETHSSEDLNQEQRRLLGSVFEHPGWGENRFPPSEDDLIEMVDNTQWDSFPNVDVNGITVFPADLRLFPKEAPVFGDWRKTGEGFPFDQAQISRLPAQLPVHLWHRSQDGAWYFVQTSMGSGWVKQEAIASVDSTRMKRFQRGPFVVALKDKLPLLDAHHRFYGYSSIGTLYSERSHTSAHHFIRVAYKNREGKARAILLPVNKNEWKTFPLQMTEDAMLFRISHLMGQPYGWGGLYGYRDCSETMRDLFAGFGMWLPRNSKAQRSAGLYVNLHGLSSHEKIDRIKKLARPFLTLIHLNGHVGLYIGIYHGELCIFQNVWGVRTRDIFHSDGRAVLGRAGITSLTSGENYWNVPATWLDKVEGLTRLDGLK